mgnify:CR=1 FL=1
MEAISFNVCSMVLRNLVESNRVEKVCLIVSQCCMDRVRMRMEAMENDASLEIFDKDNFCEEDSMIDDDDDDAFNVKPPPPPRNCSNTDTVLHEW